MAVNDYIRMMTQQVVSYLDQPKQKRKQQRKEHRANRPPFLNRWFGVIPFALWMLFRKK